MSEQLEAIRRRFQKVVPGLISGTWEDIYERVKAKFAEEKPEPEPTYRTPTIRDLLNGPIKCEVRKEGWSGWLETTLSVIDTDSTHQTPYGSWSTG